VIFEQFTVAAFLVIVVVLLVWKDFPRE
jgi:hypothetical protein